MGWMDLPQSVVHSSTGNQALTSFPSISNTRLKHLAVRFSFGLIHVEVSIIGCKTIALLIVLISFDLFLINWWYPINIYIKKITLSWYPHHIFPGRDYEDAPSANRWAQAQNWRCVLRAQGSISFKASCRSVTGSGPEGLDSPKISSGPT